MIVTGEASGDLHASNLIRAARELDPNLEFFGVGGARMEEAGCDILIPGRTISVMGIVEVLGRIVPILQALLRLKAILRGPHRPDLLVLVDFPDFNLRLAAAAKKAGVPVLYYVSPQVWAWRRGRVKKIARIVDRLAAILPFEPPLYAGLDIDVEYVGNPLTDQAVVRRERDELLAAIGLDPARPVIGLFPGSRENELRYNLATLLAAGRLIQQGRPDVQFLLPLAPTVDRTRLEEAVSAADLFVVIVEESIYDVANACSGVLAVSGTVTLQVALTGTPLAILYRMAPLTYSIGRHLVRVDFIGLPNIIAGEEVAPEFVQNAATPEALAAPMLRLLDDPVYAEAWRAGMQKVRDRIGPGGCSGRVAAMAVEMAHGQIRRRKSSHAE